MQKKVVNMLTSNLILVLGLLSCIGDTVGFSHRAEHKHMTQRRSYTDDFGKLSDASVAAYNLHYRIQKLHNVGLASQTTNRTLGLSVR